MASKIAVADLQVDADPVEELVHRLQAARLPAPATRRRIREEAGVSLREAAQALGVHPMTVLRWETGAVVPTRSNAAAYRRLLDRLAGAAA